MRKLLIACITFIVVAAPVTAQDCGNGLPCGAIPWPLPGAPGLSSPTPMPTINVDDIDQNPNPGQPTNTPTPQPTPTSIGEDLGVVSLEDQIATLQALVDATPIVVAEQGVDTPDLGSGASTVFGLVLAIQGVHFGVLTPLVTFGFFMLFFVISFKTAFIILPVVAVIFGFVRKVVNTILEFIPL
jgi:hypothetical protein